MIADRKLTPEEKEKLRDFNTREILRRRLGSPGGAAEAEAEVDAEVAARLAAGGASCPDCGTPYGQRKRCYRCKPPNPKGVFGSARPRPAPAPVAPVAPEAEVLDMPPPAPGHLLGPEEVDRSDPVGASCPRCHRPVPIAGNLCLYCSIQAHLVPLPVKGQLPDPIAALRRVVDALAGLDPDAARWVLESALRLPHFPEAE